MKWWFTCIVGLCFTLSQPIPKVSWNITEYDMGLIPHGAADTLHFVFTNISNDSIRLDNVRTSCGCTFPFWTRDYIQPGDTSHIVIEYDGQDYGSFEKKIKVFIRQQRKPEKLLIRGETY